MKVMMDIASGPPWIPEDDLLLKNAVEAGASLESLAKGAVQFSRKYTVRELRDRWHSLLYDSDVSAEASACMVKLELSGSSVPSKSNGNGVKESLAEGRTKRGVHSIRRQYYSMRKRLCSQIYDSFGMVLHDGTNSAGPIGDGGACEKDMMVHDESVACNCNDGAKTDSLGKNNLNKSINHLVVDNLVNYRNCSGLEEIGQSPSLPDIPLWKTIEDVSAPTMPVHVSLESKDHGEEEPLVVSDDLKDSHGNDVLKESITVSGEHMTHLSDTLLNFTNEDELLFMDIEGKGIMDKSCYDNLDSLLLNSPCEIPGNDAPDICEPQKLDSETKPAIPSGTPSTVPEIIANPLECSSGDDLHSIPLPGNDAQSSVTEQCSAPPDFSCEFMYCVLNTEDPEIPSNDDIGPPIMVPSSVTQPIRKDSGYPVSSFNSQRSIEPEVCLKKEDSPLHALTASHLGRPELVTSISSNHPPVLAVKAEFPGRNHISAVSGQGNIVSPNHSQSRLAHGTMKTTADGCLKEEENDAPTSGKGYPVSKGEKHKDFSKSETNSLTLNHEDEDEDDDKDDIPYFSDIETMILEMDLSPTDQESNARKEVSRYQHADSKRTIMRLEQCAQSFMHRDIASRGALAILFGRHLKQYIRKSEVILGRATDDIKVDIDLGREGRANKISRRQALIKMEVNGSFIIKNLGKSSIFLNGKEVATGQLRGLSSSSLIEIRDMAFIFEINKKSVGKFLESMDKKRDGKNDPFTWLPEGGRRED